VSTADETRIYPPYEADERVMLDAWLEYHRATLLVKCAGLSEAQLRERAVPPSSLSLLGLVRHMAEVERSWFRKVLAGEEAPYYFITEDDEDADFNAVDDASVSEAFDTWRAACDFARAAVADAPSLDVLGKRPRGNGALVSLRWILVHMLEEYARHNGHADLLRERIDGSVGY
jgi:uncharacterized damage-inducible protein DinB